MIIKSINKTEDTFLEYISKKFSTLNNTSSKECMNKSHKIIMNVFKVLIGKSHEYTINESLFILNKEIHIEEEDYLLLKEILILFSYYKFGNHQQTISREVLDVCISDFINILENIIRLNNKTNENEDLIKRYQEEENKVKVKVEINNTKEELEIEKRNIQNIEKDLIRRINNKTILKKKRKLKILKKEHNSEDIFNENIFNDEKVVDISHKESSKYYNEVKKIFKEMFKVTVGVKLEDIGEYIVSENKKKLKELDLYIKYFLLKGNDIKKIKAYYKNKISTTLLNKTLKDNDNYLEEIKKYRRLSFFQEIIIIIFFSIISKRDLKKDLKELYKKKYNKKDVNFILDCIMNKS